ncbi:MULTISPECIES: ParB N-terminal domain-containing protein [unclassified Rhizobium]|uniref:ParB N-terminal domain-containing protein n=1 Tax=unclassified Rhizobium TaxID=2613769 RepID=UPI000EA8A504|nr:MULTISPECIES: ParB N-terminal domain-containing protein [unclassified Rhizobium]AYG70034.1 hypothetical protein CCGE531_28675 [Rhizobium sp. CCGE531]AYG76410.1 hypothetical protein CCGE532_28150 [Rhizobium sp. CCGE532]
MPYCLLPPTDLIPTEEVDARHVLELEDQIARAEYWKVPITAHKDALFIMDGHHRLAVAKRLQLKALPVVLLDYESVRVEAWRLGETITPEAIFAMARSGRKFPAKTTRHFFAAPLPECAIPLNDLRRATPP